MRWIPLALCLGLTGPTTWSFERDEVDKPPAGFDLVTNMKSPEGKWSVLKDGDTKVLAQLDKGQTPGRFAMAIVKDSSYKDLALSVRGKAVSGKIDQSVGLVWRYQDPENYYLARSNVLEQNVTFYTVVKGKRRELSGADYVALKTGDWQNLKIEHRGNALKVFLGEKMLFETEDKTFPNAGKIGLWIKADSVTYFDDLTVEELK